MKNRVNSTCDSLLLTTLFISLLLWPVVLSSSIATAAEDKVGVSILFFNDLHGYLQPYTSKTDEGKKEVGGLARIATLVDSIRKENREKGIHTFVFIAGDILQGSPMSTVFHGKPDIECFNALFIDAMTIGNHEFDFGIDNFLSLQEMANFPFISSNIVWKKSRKPLAAPFAEFQLADELWLTVIGTTTMELLTTTKPEYVAALDVIDSIDAVKSSFATQKNRGPVILLSHSKYEKDRDIAKAIPELTAIIGGHDHVLLTPYHHFGGVRMFQAFEKGQYLGKIDLQVSPSTKHAEIIGSEYLPITAEIKQDPAIEQHILSYYSKIEEEMRLVIGRAVNFLDGERHRIRYGETNLGNYITDTMREQSGAQIAFLNSGSIRSSIEMGDITIEKIIKTIPFPNEIVLLELSGEEIVRVLNRSVQGSLEDEDGGFLQVSGIRFSIRDHGVEDIVIGKKFEAMDQNKMYRVAITDFLYSGGDGYSLFSAKEAYKTGFPLREVMVEAIRSSTNISAKTDGRIRRIRP